MIEESREIGIERMLLGKWDGMTIAGGGEQPFIGMKPFLTTAGAGFDSFLKYISFIYERDTALSLQGSLYDSIFHIPESYGYLAGKGYPFFDNDFIFLMLVDEAGEEEMRGEKTRYRASRQGAKKEIAGAARGRKAEPVPDGKELPKTGGGGKRSGKTERIAREFVENIPEGLKQEASTEAESGKRRVHKTGGGERREGLTRPVGLNRLIRHFGKTRAAEILTKRNLLPRLALKSPAFSEAARFSSIISGRAAALPFRTGKTGFSPLFAASSAAGFNGGDYFTASPGLPDRMRRTSGDFEFLRFFEPETIETDSTNRQARSQRPAGTGIAARKSNESPAVSAVSGKTKISGRKVFIPPVFPVSAGKVNSAVAPVIEGRRETADLSISATAGAVSDGRSKGGRVIEKTAGGKIAPAALKKEAVSARGKKTGAGKTAGFDEHAYEKSTGFAPQTFSVREGVPSRGFGSAAQPTVLGFEPDANLPFMDSIYLPSDILKPYSPVSPETGYGYDQIRGSMDAQPELIHTTAPEDIFIEDILSGGAPGLRKSSASGAGRYKAAAKNTPGPAIPAKRDQDKILTGTGAGRRPGSSGLIFVSDSGAEPVSTGYPLASQESSSRAYSEIRKGIPFSLISGGREKPFESALRIESGFSGSTRAGSLTGLYHHVPFSATGATMTNTGLLSIEPRLMEMEKVSARPESSYIVGSRAVKGDFKYLPKSFSAARDVDGDLVFLIQQPEETAAEIYGASKETWHSRTKADAVSGRRSVARTTGKDAVESSKDKARKVSPAAVFEKKAGKTTGVPQTAKRAAEAGTAITGAYSYPGKITYSSSITQSFPYLPFVETTGHSRAGAAHAAGRLREPADFERVLTAHPEFGAGKGGEFSYASDYGAEPGYVSRSPGRRFPPVPAHYGALTSRTRNAGGPLHRRQGTFYDLAPDSYQNFAAMDLVELSPAKTWETPDQTSGIVSYMEARRGLPPVLSGLPEYILKSPVLNLQTFKRLLQARPERTAGRQGAGAFHEPLPASHPLYEILVGIRGFENKPLPDASTPAATGGLHDDFDFAELVLSMTSEDRMFEGRIRKGETSFERIFKSRHGETLPQTVRAGSWPGEARGSLEVFGRGETFQSANPEENLELISPAAPRGAGLGTNLASAFSRGPDVFKSAGELPLVTPSIKAVSQTALASRKEPGEQPGGTARTEQAASPGGGGKEGEVEKIDIKTLAMEMAERIMKRLKIEKERRGL
ncbi:MAG: hypothetical protein FJ088_00060 [Deltaproteobacteria bacterium]|nr:hypothetical protein [Deltaproteobacteria bacterium]